MQNSLDTLNDLLSERYAAATSSRGVSSCLLESCPPGIALPTPRRGPVVAVVTNLHIQRRKLDIQ